MTKGIDESARQPTKARLAKARAAMQGGKSARVREEWVDRAYASGMIGFLDRWSRKKTLHNRGKQGRHGGGSDDTDR